MRDDRTVLQVLARSLNPSEGGSNPRILKTTGKVQKLYKVAASSGCNGSPHHAVGSPLYVVVTPQSFSRLRAKGNKKKKKEKVETIE